MEKEQKIVRKEDEVFRCLHCGSKDMRWPWAGRTDQNRIYLLFVCGDCEEMTPIEIDRVITPLYTTDIVLAPGSKLVN